MSSRADVVKGLLVYPCKGGWIDKNHAMKKTSRPYVGADNLWRQISGETGQKSRFPGVNGYKVTYTQDATRFRIGVTKSYLVKTGLPVAAKESVALAIFQEVSMGFESMQAMGAIIGSDSSFSVEDLVSNLVSFYYAVRPGTDYLSLLQAVSTAASLEVWDKTGPVGSHKNRKFEPVYFDCKDCTAKGPFPSQLQQITSAVKSGSIEGPNEYFRDWLPLDEWYDGRPPMTGPKY